MGCVVSFVKLAFWHTLCCGPVAVVLPLIWALIHLLGFHPTRAVEILKMSWFGLFPIGKRLERTRDELPKDCPNRGCLLELYWAALWWPTALASFFVLLAVQIVAGIISGILSDIFDSKDIKLIGDYWDYFYWYMDLDSYGFIVVPHDWTPELPPSVGPFNSTQKCTISLRSHHKRFLSVDDDGDISADALYNRESEEFVCFPLDNGKVVLQNKDGNWLTVNCVDKEWLSNMVGTAVGSIAGSVGGPDAASTAVSAINSAVDAVPPIVTASCNLTECTEDAIFEVIVNPDGSVGFKNKYNLFMSADEEHDLSWNQSGFGVNESWTVVVQDITRNMKDYERPQIVKVPEDNTIDVVVDAVDNNELAHVTAHVVPEHSENAPPPGQIDGGALPEYEAPPLYTAVETDAPPPYDAAPAYDETAEMLPTESAPGTTEGVADGYHVQKGDDVKGFLNSIGSEYVDEYYQLFVDNGFDTMELLRTLSDEDLVAVGVSKMGHRRKILMECQKKRM